MKSFFISIELKKMKKTDWKFIIVGFIILFFLFNIGISFFGTTFSSQNTQIHETMLIKSSLNAPTLNPISPNLVLDGTVRLNWTDVTDATHYYIYRNNSPITSIESLIPIANTSRNDHIDLIINNGIYFYVIIASSSSGNSSLSNCVNVQVDNPNAFVSGLYSGRVTPPSGQLSTEYNFSVYYLDTENLESNFVKVLINGTPFPMKKQDPSNDYYVGGCLYQYLITPPTGVFTYSFICNNSRFFNSTIEQISSNPGFLVNHSSPFELENTDIENSTLIWNLTQFLPYPYSDYDFFNDVDGSNPLGWVVSEGSNTYIDVIPEKDGHVKVVELWDNSASRICWMKNTFSSKVSGNVEFWVSGKAGAAGVVYIILASSTNYRGPYLEINWNHQTLGYYDGNITYHTIITSPGFTEQTWHHIRIAFNCTTDKFNIWVDGNQEGSGIPFMNNLASMKLLWVCTASAGTQGGASTFIDDIDYSWTTDNCSVNYPLGSNYAIFLNGTQLTSWKEYKAFEQISFNVCGACLGEGLYNLSLIFNNALNQWFHNDIKLKVNCRLKSPVLAISPNPSTDGIVSLDWSTVEGATIYYIFRSRHPIKFDSQILPLTSISTTSYQDSLPYSGAWYYAIIAGNFTYQSAFSNCEGVWVYHPNAPQPGLSSGSVSLTSSYNFNGYNFSVCYSDPENEPPDYVNLAINGTIFPMEKQNSSDSNYRDGCWYQFLINPPPGFNEYSFICNNSQSLNSTIVKMMYNSGIMVNHSSNLELQSNDSSICTLTWNLTQLLPYPYAVYDFLDDIDGSNPHGWDITESSKTSIDVTPEKYGRIKVVELWDNTTSGWCSMRNTFLPQTTGSVEFWISGKAGAAGVVYIILASSTDYRGAFLEINWNHQTLGYYDGNNNYHTIIASPGFTEQTWHHIRINFDCTTDILNVWIDGNQEGINLPFVKKLKSMKLLWICTATAGTQGDASTYVDGIDYSWASGYVLNRNMEFSSPRYAILMNNIRETPWRVCVWQVQIDYNVSGMRLGAGVHNISLVFNNYFQDWYHEDIFVKVKPRLNSPVLASFSPNPSTDGIISLDWSTVEGATAYYLFRSRLPIIYTFQMLPIMNISLNHYQDSLSYSGTWYYAIIAGNSSGRSLLSNCESVWVDHPNAPLPGLSSGSVSPTSSYLYNFSVYYFDPENEPPKYVNLVLTGTSYPMEKRNSSDTNYFDGCLYQCLASPPIGAFNYYFKSNNSQYFNSTTIKKSYNPGYNVTYYNHTITWNLYEPPYYEFLGEYSFTNDHVNQHPSNWLISEEIDTNISVVISHEDHHQKVLKVTSLSGNQAKIAQKFSTQPANRGTTYEYYIRSDDVNTSARQQTVYNDYLNQSHCQSWIQFSWTDGKIRSITDMGNSSQIIYDGLIPGIWYHIRVEHVAYFKNKIWVNNEYCGEFNTYNYYDLFDQIQFAINNKGSFFIDAIDYSWAPNFFINRNQEKNIFLHNPSYTIFLDNFKQMNWQQWSISAQITYNLNKTHYQAGIYNVSLVFNDSFGNWHHADINLKEFIQSNLTTPVLEPIMPRYNYDGIITLNWSTVEGATDYYIHRSRYPIITVYQKTPIINLSVNQYQDTVPYGGSWYYLIVASNTSDLSTLSNCESVEVNIPPPAPILAPILPNPNADGIIKLNWSESPSATTYYIFRDNYPISSVDGLTSLACLSRNYYQDTIRTNEIYYYVIVASNIDGNSSISNCVSIQVDNPYAFLPGLFSGSVTPPLGYPSFDYNFSVYYTDPDNMLPNYVNLLLNGYSYHMEKRNPSDNNYVDGCLYQYLTPLPIGVFNYSFMCGTSRGFNSTTEKTLYNPRFNLNSPSDLELDPVDSNNHTLSWTLFQHFEKYNFLAEYSFKDDDSGTNPSGWAVSEGSNTYIDVIPEKDGRDKVVEIWDNSASGYCWMKNTFSSKVSGNVEFWVSGKAGTKGVVYIILASSTDSRGAFLEINWNHQTLGYYDGNNNHHTIIASPGFTEQTWHHIRINFDCTTDKFNVWIDGNQEGTNLPFVKKLDSMKLLWVCTASAGTQGDASTYIDAIDYSWAPGYYLNRNLDSKLSYAILINGTRVTPWQKWTGQVQINFNVSGILLGIGVHNISLVFNDTLNHWFHDNITVIVNSRLNPPVLESISPNPDNDGIIVLNWNDIEGATEYNIYRSRSPIISISYMIPITNVSVNTYQDTVSQGGNWYYAIVAGNLTHRSSHSNCESVLVTIPPPAPILAPIFPNPDVDGVIQLNWSESVSATTYYIFRDNFPITSLEESSLIANVSESCFQDLIQSNGLYYYAVVASHAGGNSTISNCEGVTVAIPPQAPTLSPIFPSSSNSGIIELNWNDIPEATTYVLFRGFNTNSFSEMRLIAETSHNSYVDSVTLKGIYYYAIIASNSFGNSSLSNFEAVDVTVPPSTPFLSHITPNPSTNGTIELNWNNVEGATTYYVLRDTTFTTAPHEWQSVFIVTGCSYTDRLYSDGTYYYSIIAGDTLINSSVSNCESVEVRIMTPPDTLPPPQVTGVEVTFLLTANALNLTWTSSPASDLTEYAIYRSTTSGFLPDLFHPYATTQINSYLDTNVINGVTYYYRISAVDEVPNYGLPSDEISGTPIQPNSSVELEAPVLELLSQNPNGVIELDWNGVAGATVYYLIRDTSYITTFHYLQSTFVTSENHYTDEISSNGTYYYAVLAGDALSNSSLSNCENVTVNILPPSYPPSITDFRLHSSPIFSNDLTPTVICQVMVSGAGINLSSVEYAYSTTGDPNPSNWVSVDGIFLDANCSIPASDGATGALYLKVNKVPFNQFSVTENTIRFRAADLAGIETIQETPITIEIIDVLSTPDFTFLFLIIIIGALTIGAYSSYVILHRHREEHRIIALLERIKARQEASDVDPIPLPEFSTALLNLNEEFIPSVGESQQPVPILEIASSNEARTSPQNITFVDLQSIVTTLLETFPSLFLFPEEEGLPYLKDITNQSQDEIWAFLAELTTRIPKGEICTQLPVLVAEVMNLDGFELWQPALEKLSDLIDETDAFGNCQLLTKFLQLIVLIKCTSVNCREFPQYSMDEVPIESPEPPAEAVVPQLEHLENSSSVNMACMTFMQMLRVVNRLTAIFPSLDLLLPKEERLPYLMDLKTLPDAKIFTSITRLIAVIPDDEMFNKIPTLMSEMNKVENLGHLDSILTRITDLFILAGSRNDRHFLNELILLPILIRYTTMEEVNTLNAQ